MGLVNKVFINSCIGQPSVLKKVLRELILILTLTSQVGITTVLIDGIDFTKLQMIDICSKS